MKVKTFLISWEHVLEQELANIGVLELSDEEF